MANQEHLDILKQGIKVWNQWREEYPEIQPDLSGTDLERLNLRGRINLNAANLQETNLRFADLGNAHIKEANLKKANLHRTILAGANFNLTNLTEADLTLADLSVAALAFANLSSANLDRAMFIRSHLIGTNLDRAYVSFTVFERVDLRFTKGLEAVTHGGPSHIGIDTIYASHGQIPEK